MTQSISNINKIKESVRARKTPRQSRAKETATRILTAARTILENEGRKSLTARRLAKECGLTTGAIYDHFPGISAVLYQLYDERLGQNVGIFQEIYGNDNGERTLEELIDEHLVRDSQFDWGGRFDLELDEAVKSDPKLRALDEHNLTMQRDLLVQSIIRRRPEATKEQAQALASYFLEIFDVAYRLRHASDLTETDLVYRITVDFVKQLVEYELP